MHYADAVGVKNVYEKICEFRDLYGEGIESSTLLKQLAEEGKSLLSGTERVVLKG